MRQNCRARAVFISGIAPLNTRMCAMSLNGNHNGNGNGAATMPPPRKKTAEAIPTNEVITRDPFPASTRIYVEGERAGVKVPMREITLNPGHPACMASDPGHPG